MADLTTTERDLIEKLADSFVARLRAGERPSIDEYSRQYPELADELQEILPALILLEQHASLGDGDDFQRSARVAAVAPSEIGDFTIIREIGRGGMGIVYEAVQQSLGRHVALKVLAAPALLNPSHLERFHLEARAAARLHHTHIVPVFGVGEHNGLHYYAMQFIRGQSLDQVIDALRQLRGRAKADRTTQVSNAYTAVAAKSLLTGKLAEEAADIPGLRGTNDQCGVAANIPVSAPGHAELSATHIGHEFHRSVARVGLEVVEALAYAHGEGILHRDIKPSNLLLDARGNTWITDFGLAKTEGTDGLTQTGDFVGTLRYMAPERFEGWSDRRSDIYGLGATLYEMLTLQTLYQGSSRAQLVDQILNVAPVAPKKLDATVPQDLETIILKAMAKEPAERYHTAEEMAEDLRRFLADRPIVARRATPLEQLIRWRRRNPAVAGLTAMVIALLVTIIAVLANSNARARRESAARAITLQGKDAALKTARDAVTQMLSRVGTDTYLDVPLSHPLRANLLEDAIKLYDALRAEGGADHDLNREEAAALQTLAVLQRELGRHDDAGRSLERCIRLLISAHASDPDPPSVREAIAEAELVLAYTWEYQTVPPSSDDPKVESQYRHVLALYQELERDWPQRRWQYVLVLRYLAGLEARRQHRDEAKRLWREGIANGEAYLAQNNDDIEARISVCWACAEFFDALIADSPEDRVEGSALVNRGLHHAAVAIDQAPQSEAGTDVRAALHFRQALCHWRDDRPVQALEDFQVAIDEIESLCEEFPWNSGYWNSSQLFHAEAVNQMRRAGRTDDVLSTVRRYRDWLQKIAANAPHDFLPQEMLAQSQSQAIALLREAGLEAEAEEVAASIE